MLIVDWLICWLIYPRAQLPVFNKYKTTDFKDLIVCSTKEQLKARSTVMGLILGLVRRGNKILVSSPKAEVGDTSLNL